MLKNKELLEKIFKSMPPGSECEAEIGGMRLKVIKFSQNEKPKETKPEIPPKNIVTVTSPTVGYFFPLVKIGDAVEKGKKIGEVISMKVPVEILSLVNGIVKEILAKESEAVEYGQPLFIIEAYE